MTQQLEPKPNHVVAMEELPRCDLCGQPASWDAPLGDTGIARPGAWAYMCDSCQIQHGKYPGRTGLGVGQRLVRR
jgi:hypothetical protein